ncbi:hypothetical protein [Ralstonia sp. 1138]|uniref:hypothetical protein n=1 Tax=Ralstonia sp. 1138 TaxID=3156423 RepID=UPI003396E1CF
MVMQMLMEASRHGQLAVEEAIDRLHRTSPELFHTEQSLGERVFVDAPKRGEPCRRFVRQPERPSG